MNRSTFRLMPYINRAKTRADGTTAILLRITIDSKKTVMTTDFSCRPELWDAKQGEIISPTKTDNSKPVFPLPPYANDRLYKEFVVIGIFLGLDRRSAEGRLQGKNLSHHDARHTNATLLVSAGVNMESVSKMMGHSSIKSTQKYAQITVNRIS